LEDRTAPAVRFSPPVNYDVGTTPISVAVSDFDNDGVLDLALPSLDFDSWGLQPSVRVLLGNGDGTFRDQIVVDAGLELPRWISVADFNRDGHQDIALVSGWVNLGSILLGNGDGTFKNPMPFTAGGNSAYLASADLNVDGNPDLLVADLNNHRVNV